MIAPEMGMEFHFMRDRANLTVDYAGEFDLSEKTWDQKANVKLNYAF